MNAHKVVIAALGFRRDNNHNEVSNTNNSEVKYSNYY